MIGLGASEGGRAQFENAVADKLAARDVLAVASGNLISSMEDVNRTAVREWVQTDGYDAVIVTRLVDTQKQTSYKPPTYTEGSYQITNHTPVGLEERVLHAPSHLAVRGERPPFAAVPGDKHDGRPARLGGRLAPPGDPRRQRQPGGVGDRQHHLRHPGRRPVGDQPHRRPARDQKET